MMCGLSHAARSVLLLAARVDEKYQRRYNYRLNDSVWNHVRNFVAVKDESR